MALSNASVKTYAFKARTAPTSLFVTARTLSETRSTFEWNKRIVCVYVCELPQKQASVASKLNRDEPLLEIARIERTGTG